VGQPVDAGRLVDPTPPVLLVDEIDTLIAVLRQMRAVWGM